MWVNLSAKGPSSVLNLAETFVLESFEQVLFLSLDEAFKLYYRSLTSLDIVENRLP